MPGGARVDPKACASPNSGPGAARLLSVLSLQSLPRRLLFDFRDLFAEGFAFDSVVGDVKIGQGQAAIFEHTA